MEHRADLLYQSNKLFQQLDQGHDDLLDIFDWAQKHAADVAHDSSGCNWAFPCFEVRTAGFDYRNNVSQ